MASIVCEILKGNIWLRKIGKENRKKKKKRDLKVIELKFGGGRACQQDENGF